MISAGVFASMAVQAANSGSAAGERIHDGKAAPTNDRSGGRSHAGGLPLEGKLSFCLGKMTDEV